GELHEAERLPVALGMRHAEVPVELVLGISTLLVAHHNNGTPLEAGQATDNGVIIPEKPVPMELYEVFGEKADQVQCVRASRVTGQLDSLPGGELPEALALEPLEPLLEASRLRLDSRAACAPEGLDAGFQLQEWALEVQCLLEIAGFRHRSARRQAST